MISDFSLFIAGSPDVFLTFDGRSLARLFQASKPDEDTGESLNALAKLARRN